MLFFSFPQGVFSVSWLAKGLIYWTTMIGSKKMNLASLTALSVLLITGTGIGQPADDPVADEKSRLQGEWACTKVEINGEAVDQSLIAALTQTFKGDTLSFHRGGEHTGDVAYEIDPTKTPKSMDWTYSSPERLKGKTRRGIYRLEGDTLTICFNISVDREERPTRFEAAPESGHFLHVYKRVAR